MSVGFFFYSLLMAIAIGVLIFIKSPAGKRWLDSNSK